MASDETVLGGGHYSTDAVGHRAMLAAAQRWPERTWAIEGCQGAVRHMSVDSCREQDSAGLRWTTPAIDDSARDPEYTQVTGRFR
jgi:hypothetical protein